MRASILFSSAKHLDTAESIIQKFAKTSHQVNVDGASIVVSAEIRQDEIPLIKQDINVENAQIGSKLDTFTLSTDTPKSQPH